MQGSLVQGGLGLWQGWNEMVMRITNTKKEMTLASGEGPGGGGRRGAPPPVRGSEIAVVRVEEGEGGGHDRLEARHRVVLRELGRHLRPRVGKRGKGGATSGPPGDNLGEGDPRGVGGDSGGP